MSTPKTLRIALICNNMVRELVVLRALKKELEQQLHAQVEIMGSIAEIQRMYYLLGRFSPHLVFFSQLQEKSCRDLASYVKASGGKVIVMPEEITPAKVVQTLILNPKLKNDHLIDMALLPGKVMRGIYLRTDINPAKLFITGSPKMDLEFTSEGMKRQLFLKKFNINPKKKNIFIFTSFAHTGNLEYFKLDGGFSGSMRLLSKIQKVIIETKNSYLTNLPNICRLLTDYNVILKLHPLETIESYRHFKLSNLSIVKNISLLDCLDSIDLAIHWNSTVSTSCWLHDIPTVQYAPIRKHNWLLSGFSAGNPLVHDYHQILGLVTRCFSKTRCLPKKYLLGQREYLSNNFFKVDGKSLKRIGNLIDKHYAQTIWQVHYKQHFNPLLHIIFFLEKLIGIYWSRRLIAYLLANYNWRYAVDNYLPMTKESSK